MSSIPEPRRQPPKNSTRRQPPKNSVLDEKAIEPQAQTPAPASGEELVVGDLLVEDVSIDGMCGVY
jgi:mycofactocin precursor